MFNFVFCVIFSALIFNVYSQEKLKVSLYIESLCPDTKAFMTKQFYPGYEKLSSYLDMDIVPYGKGYHTHIDGVWNFQCQHGYRECYGNRVQACALAQNYDQDTMMAWLNCIFKEASPVSAMRSCASTIGLNWENLEYCSQETEQGYELLAEMGDRTHSVVPEITYVPTIIFNDVYDQQLQETALTNFLGTACSLLTEKPVVCLEK